MPELAPLSSDQERLWLRRYLYPQGSNESPAVLALGTLRPATVRSACAALVRRHETLRTRYPLTEGIPAQLVMPPAAFDVALVDLSGLDPSLRREALEALVRAEAARLFDLEHGPVVRMHLVRLASDEHVLVAAVHHIAVDPWSIVLLGEDLMALCAAAERGDPARSAPPAARYADYVSWRADRRVAHEAAVGRLFWRRRTDRMRAVELPLDHPRPPALTTEMRVHAVDLPADTSEALRRTARHEGVTPFVALLACFSIVVQRWTGQQKFMVMTVPSGRGRKEFDDVVGLFTGDVPVHCDTTGDPTVRELLLRIGESVSDTLDHPEPAFNELAALTDPERALCPHPLRQLGLVLHNRRPPEVELRRGGLRAQPVGKGFATADIWLDVFDAGAGPMRMRLEMAEAMFDAATVHLAAERFRSVMEAAMADVGQVLSEVRLCGPTEEAVLAAWGAEIDHRPAGSVARVLDDAVRRHSDRVAVVADGVHLTYRQLGRRVRDLAAESCRAGESGDCRIAIDEGAGPDGMLAALGALVGSREYGGEGLSACVHAVAHRLECEEAAVTTAMEPDEPVDVVLALATLLRGGTIIFDPAGAAGALTLLDAVVPPVRAVELLHATREVWVRHRAAGLPWWTAMARIDAPAGTERGRLPLGRPLAVELSVLDRRGRRLPVGVAGELYVSGVAASTAFPGRPRVTAERLVPDPGRYAGRRWRTGEKARVDSAGLFWPGPHGRYVEFGGVCVDVSALEGALLADPAIVDVVLVVRDCPNRAGVLVPRLVAYVCPVVAGEGVAREALGRASVSLPEQVNGLTTVVVERIPRCSDGTPDLSVLPLPTMGSRGDRDGRPPGTTTERAVAEVYGLLLGVPGVSAEDSFFVLGGSSLQVCKLVERIAQRLGVRLPLLEVFHRPLVSQVAAAVDAARLDAARNGGFGHLA